MGSMSLRVPLRSPAVVSLGQTDAWIPALELQHTHHRGGLLPATPDALVADRLGLALTSDQVQHAFDALVRRGVLRPKIKGVWELETSNPELLRWILNLDAGSPQHEDLGAHDSR